MGETILVKDRFCNKTDIEKLCYIDFLLFSLFSFSLQQRRKRPASSRGERSNGGKMILNAFCERGSKKQWNLAERNP